MKYHTIYADPPWFESGGGEIRRGADRHYPLMKTKDIIKLSVQDLIEENAHLYLWVTNNHLPDGLEVMKAWGFKYKTMITWAKDRMGIGQYFRGMSEHVLFGVKGNIPYKLDENGKRMQGKTLFHAKRTEHSVKPEDMRTMIETVSIGPYLELFARKQTPGWDVWGNEVDSKIIINDQKQLELFDNNDLGLSDEDSY